MNIEIKILMHKEDDHKFITYEYWKNIEEGKFNTGYSLQLS